MWGWSLSSGCGSGDRGGWWPGESNIAKLLLHWESTRRVEAGSDGRLAPDVRIRTVSGAVWCGCTRTRRRRRMAFVGFLICLPRGYLGAVAAVQSRLKMPVFPVTRREEVHCGAGALSLVVVVAVGACGDAAIRVCRGSVGRGLGRWRWNDKRLAHGTRDLTQNALKVTSLASEGCFSQKQRRQQLAEVCARGR